MQFTVLEKEKANMENIKTVNYSYNIEIRIIFIWSEDFLQQFIKMRTLK